MKFIGWGKKGATTMDSSCDSLPLDSIRQNWEIMCCHCGKLTSATGWDMAVWQVLAFDSSCWGILWVVVGWGRKKEPATALTACPGSVSTTYQVKGRPGLHEILFKNRGWGFNSGECSSSMLEALGLILSICLYLMWCTPVIPPEARISIKSHFWQ